MANTPVYGIPYPVAGDAPNGPSQMQALALDVETELVRIDSDIANIKGLANVSASTSTDETGIVSGTYSPGSSPVGVAFTAPESGEVLVLWSGYIQATNNGGATILSFEMKTGSTVGSGTLVGTAANSDRSIIVGKAVNSGAPALNNAGQWSRYFGLTPGANYNVRLMHAVDGGTGVIVFRQIAVYPQI